MKKDKNKGFLYTRGWLPRPPKQKIPSQIPLFLKVTILILPLVTAVTWYYLIPTSTAPVPTSVTDASDTSPPSSTSADNTLKPSDLLFQYDNEDHGQVVRFHGSLEGEFEANMWNEPQVIHLRANWHARPGWHIPRPPVLRFAEGVWPNHGGILVGEDFEMYIYEIGKRVWFGYWWVGPQNENYKLLGSGTYMYQSFYYHITLQDATIYEAFFDRSTQSWLYKTRWGPQTIQFSLTFHSDYVDELLEKLE